MTPQRGITGDRQVHAVLGNGAEVVRYDRAGKWYVEDAYRRRVSLRRAAELAVKYGEAINFGMPGGMRFDAEVHRLKALA